MTRRVVGLLALAACLAALPAAAWQVIGHEAGAVPVGQAIGDLLERYAEREPAAAQVRTAGPARPGIALPLRSVLSPQAGLRSIRLQTGLTTPLCVVGSDELSRNWLQANRRRLAELGARCVLVEARSERDIKTMVRAAHPVPLAALPFDDIAQLHGIPGYPVLLTGAAP